MSHRLKLPFMAPGFTTFPSSAFFFKIVPVTGARIVLCDPHRAVVVGPSPLYGQELSSPDIRAGMTLLLAALCASGTTVIRNIGQIDRGYQHVDDKLRALGAHIERMPVTDNG